MAFLALSSAGRAAPRAGPDRLDTMAPICTLVQHSVGRWSEDESQIVQ